MKNNKLILLLVLITSLWSCESFVTGVDEVDPTQPTDATLDLVVTAGQVAYIGFMEGDMARLAGMFAGQATGADRQYIVYQNYTITAGDFDAPWGNLYASVLKSFKIAKDKAIESNNRATLGMIQVLEGHALGMAASLWGGIPYTEAINLAEFPNPNFETRAGIYTTVQGLLDAGIVNLNSGIGNLKGDIFDLSAAEYVAIANTAKAKFYLHLGDYANAITSANAGIVEGGDLMAPHGTSYAQDFNIWYSFLVYDRAGYMGASTSYVADLLDPGYYGAGINRGNAKTVEDARYSWYFQPFEFYAPGGHEHNYFSVYDDWYGEGFFGTETDYPILTYSENQLILAEAFVRTGNNNSALLALNDHRAYLDGMSWYPAETWADIYGYPASSLYDPYALTDFDPAAMENADGVSQASALYREIIEEKYVTLTGTIEVFTDVRRPGFGDFSGGQNWEMLGITPNTGTNIPQRFLYPQVEINSNTNTPPQSTSDVFTSMF